MLVLSESQCKMCGVIGGGQPFDPTLTAFSSYSFLFPLAAWKDQAVSVEFMPNGYINIRMGNMTVSSDNIAGALRSLICQMFPDPQSRLDEIINKLAPGDFPSREEKLVQAIAVIETQMPWLR